MNNEPITFSAVWNRAWGLVLDNCFVLISMFILSAARVIFLSGLTLPFFIKYDWGFAAFMAVALLIGMGASLEIGSTILNLARGKSVRAFSFLPLKAVLAWMVIQPFLMFIEICGTLVLVFPGVLAASYFGFFAFALLDGHSPLEALKLSFRIAQKSHRPVLTMTGIFFLPYLFTCLPHLGPFFMSLELVNFMALAVIYDHFVGRRSNGSEVADVQ